MPADAFQPDSPRPGDFQSLQYTRPFVLDDGVSKSLHFTQGELQSRMLTHSPWRLEVDYTRTMMGFLLFNPAPGHIGMIGLGGGSIAKFCHRHLPDGALTVVEINPHVIALRERFQVPPDGPRFRVVQDDGAHFVATTHDRFDVLLIDAFGHGLEHQKAHHRARVLQDQCIGLAQLHATLDRRIAEVHGLRIELLADERAQVRVGGWVHR